MLAAHQLDRSAHRASGASVAEGARGERAILHPVKACSEIARRKTLTSCTTIWFSEHRNRQTASAQLFVSIHIRDIRLQVLDCLL